MYDHYQYSKYLALGFFISLIIMGQMILLNLFLAILLENFSMDEVHDKTEKKDKDGVFKRLTNNFKKKFKKCEGCFRIWSKRKDKYQESANESSEESNQEESKQEPKSNSLPEEEKISRDRSLPRGILKNPLQRDFVDLKREFSADAKTYSFNQNMSLRSLTLLKTPVKPKLKKIISQYPITSSGNINSAMLPKSTKLKLNSIARMRRMSTLTMNHQINNSIAQQYDFKDLKSMQKESASITTRSEEHKSGRSLCIFHRKNIVRRIDKKIAEHPYFEYFILVVIIISSITLALENPLNNPDSKLSKSLDIINIIMTSIFWIEFMMKVLANGLIFNGKQSYLRNPWNIIDFFIVIISILSIFTSNDLSFFKVIRVMRLLRPLKVIQRNEGLKVAVQALFMAIPNIFYVSVVAMLFFAIFGMTGVNMFKGKFFS